MRVISRSAWMSRWPSMKASPPAAPPAKPDSPKNSRSLPHIRAWWPPSRAAPFAADCTSGLVESKRNAFAVRPRTFRGGGTITCLHACRLPSAGERGTDECHWTVRGRQGLDHCFVAAHGRASVRAGGCRQPRCRRIAAGAARVLRTDRSRGSRLGRKPSGARCASLPESVAASGNSGRTRDRVVEDRDRPRCDRNFAGDRHHDSSSSARATTPTWRGFCVAAKLSTWRNCSST